MDQSLQRLTDSIASYNPSTTAADDLVAADDALNKDLEQREATRSHQSTVMLTASSHRAPAELPTHPRTQTNLPGA